MKSLVWASLLISCAAGAAPECQRTVREQYVSGWEEVPSQERIHQAIDPQATLGCRYLPDRDQKLNVLVRFEQGNLDGVGYRLQYADGSAVIQGNRNVPLDAAGYQDTWKLACRQATDDGGYGCTLSRADLRVDQGADGHMTLAIGGHYRKGSELLLRVDGNWAETAPVATGFSDAQTATLLKQLRTGTRADTRYRDDDLQGATDRSLPLYGFAQAMTLMDKVLEQLNHPPATTD